MDERLAFQFAKRAWDEIKLNVAESPGMDLLAPGTKELYIKFLAGPDSYQLLSTRGLGVKVVAGK